MLSFSYNADFTKESTSSTVCGLFGNLATALHYPCFQRNSKRGVLFRNWSHPLSQTDFLRKPLWRKLIKNDKQSTTKTLSKAKVISFQGRKLNHSCSRSCRNLGRAVHRLSNWSTRHKKFAKIQLIDEFYQSINFWLIVLKN